MAFKIPPRNMTSNFIYWARKKRSLPVPSYKTFRRTQENVPPVEKIMFSETSAHCGSNGTITSKISFRNSENGGLKIWVFWVPHAHTPKGGRNGISFSKRSFSELRRDILLILPPLEPHCDGVSEKHKIFVRRKVFDVFGGTLLLFCSSCAARYCESSQMPRRNLRRSGTAFPDIRLLCYVNQTEIT